NGVLSVLLAPSTDITPVAYYQAVYNSSDGLTTWTENWAVPPSATPLTLSQVRVTNTSGSGGTGGGGTGSQIAISQVTGLTSDLNAINSSLSTFNSIVDGLNLLIGNLTNTVNSLGNTVANLTAGATTANFVDDETPGGAINGTNTIFTLANTPAVPVNLTLYRNGILQTSGVDYTLSGTTITFSGNEAPQSGDALLAYYRIPGTGTASTFVDNETPAGIIDGNNVGFSLAYIPCPAISLRLFKNGALLQENVDYTLSGQMITFANSTVAPAVGDSLTAYYRIMSQNLSTSVSRGESAPVRQDR
ncbi:MAG TPA: hypothetical protein VFA65_17070, partial [Bryobacteraceae bacterium]|nr:hypothetical protein [Bryobacteraceae bacterium]